MRMSGTTICRRSGLMSTVPEPSATAATIFIEVHNPVSRLIADRVATEVERLLHVGRVEHGQMEVHQRQIRLRRDGGALGARVIADDDDRAAVSAAAPA